MSYLWLKDGTPINVIEKGRGTPLVLLPALMYTARYFFGHNIGPLSQGAHVFAPDLRGHGESGKPKSGYTIAGLANDLEELLEQRVGEPAVVMGVALGGLVLLDYLRRFGSRRLKAIGIIDMTPRLVSAPGWEHPTFGNFPQAAADVFGANVRASRDGLRDFLAAGPAVPPSKEFLDEMVAEAYLTPTDAIADLCDEMVRQDFRDFLPTIKLPTLLLYGGPKNKILPTGVGKWMKAQIPNSELVEFQQSGHMPFLEEPEAFNAAVLDFVGRVG